METLIKPLSRLIRKQAGGILIPTLVMLAVGALIIAPLMGLMATGLKAGQQIEIGAVDYYAADAGVENAIWLINRFDPEAETPDPRVPLLVGYDGAPYSMLVDGDTVNITIYKRNSTTYRVTSASAGSTIVTYVTYGRNFLDNAITSPSEVTIKPNVDVYGDIQTPILDNQGDHFGNLLDWDIAYWDAMVAMIPGFYYDQVSADPAYASSSYEFHGTVTFPNSRTSGSLNIDSKSDGTLNLTPNSVLYINGDLDFKGKNWKLNLNGATIFVNGALSSATDSPSQIKGPGCIIALNDIYFQPNSTTNDYIFMMSLNGTVHLQPTKGDFYGSVAGNTSVELWGKPVFHWQTPPALNFPDMSQFIKENALAKLLSWDIQ
ncbi:hypothetical protein [Dehalogenimonas alkenigignens]|uniref:hypothetical protein n=1 Tax=Dehalogenimonas alkenigignens TaxID=1217799 RepID=UPI001058147F|nr:hypothetical protein [Dehalogenimonas alkenigignens]